MTSLLIRSGSGASAIIICLLLCLWVVLVNGGATFYFDSIDYLKRGHQLLSLIGLDLAPLDASTESVSTSPSPTAPDDADKAIDGSRSMVYSLLIGAFFWLGAVDGMVVMNAAFAIGLVWLACRLSVRRLAHPPSPTGLTIAAIALAALGSLPFYVAFLMPDMLAPILLLSAAVLVAYAPRMRLWELAIVTVVGCLAIIVSPSHLAIWLIMMPIIFVKALFGNHRRRWLAPILALIILCAGIGEQLVLRLSAKQVQNAEVVYRPFLTARLIQDGPGYSYLEDRCPTEVEPTCALFEVLSTSADPTRFSATNIAFSSKQSNGSFLLIPAEVQLQIAQQQFQFFLDVLLDRPGETTAAIIGNIYRQLTLNSVNMTLQTDPIVKKGSGMTGMAWGEFAAGRLTANTAWLAIATPAQSLLYVLSLMGILAALICGRLPRAVSVFLVMILIGILANAIVCGVLSQPANRYGARVIWLLPVAAIIGGVVFAASRKEERLDPFNRSNTQHRSH